MVTDINIKCISSSTRCVLTDCVNEIHTSGSYLLLNSADKIYKINEKVAILQFNNFLRR